MISLEIISELISKQEKKISDLEKDLKDEEFLLEEFKIIKLRLERYKEMVYANKSKE